MKETFVVGNFKSNSPTGSIDEWIKQVLSESGKPNVTIIVCPDFTLLPQFSSLVIGSKIKLGAQNISPFEEGAHTGEINGAQIKKFADYVIIGHSERRREFNETDDELRKKVVMAKKYDLVPIYCIQDEDTFVPESVNIVAYEPPSAIGSGNPDTPENANKVIKTVKEEYGVVKALYGGSVTPENVGSFLQMPDIDGVLVGGASLDPQKFVAIIKNA
ncbi:MAG: triose-phosphate isomerase family protein [Candidatus Levyibacteriota bacterium]